MFLVRNKLPGIARVVLRVSASKQGQDLSSSKGSSIYKLGGEVENGTTPCWAEDYAESPFEFACSGCVQAGLRDNRVRIGEQLLTYQKIFVFAMFAVLALLKTTRICLQNPRMV
jgi:hypothetical protein